MDENHIEGEHSHAHTLPVQIITLTVDPNHNRLSWHFENIGHPQAIQQIELAKLFIFHEMLEMQQHEAPHV